MCKSSGKVRKGYQSTRAPYDSRHSTTSTPLVSPSTLLLAATVLFSLSSKLL